MNFASLINKNRDLKYNWYTIFKPDNIYNMDTKLVSGIEAPSVILGKDSQRHFSPM